MYIDEVLPRVEEFWSSVFGLRHLSLSIYSGNPISRQKVFRCSTGSSSVTFEEMYCLNDLIPWITTVYRLYSPHILNYCCPIRIFVHRPLTPYNFWVSMLRKLESSREEAFSKGFELISVPLIFGHPKSWTFSVPLIFGHPQPKIKGSRKFMGIR